MSIHKFFHRGRASKFNFALILWQILADCTRFALLRHTGAADPKQTPDSSFFAESAYL